MKLLLDTNIILYALKSEPVVLAWLEKAHRDGADAAVSVISVIELLGYPGISSSEEKAIRRVLDSIEKIGIDEKVIQETISIRRKSKLKMPDAIIAASALVSGRTLVTRNSADFRKVGDLNLIDPFGI